MKKRVISAVVLITALMTCVFASSYTRVLFFALAAFLCERELCTNLKLLKLKTCSWAIYLYIAGQTALVLFKAPLAASCVWFTACLYLCLICGVTNHETGGPGACASLAALAYPGALFAIVLGVLMSDVWLETLSLACFSTWLCDAFALFGGKAFGKHKIAPLVSPNKTTEGCVCGAVFSLLGGVLCKVIGNACGGTFLGASYTELPLWLCLAASLIGSTMGQLGDLAESLLKRMIGVKDFSNLIPGHGGAFDRMDSLLFSIPTVYLILKLFLAS